MKNTNHVRFLIGATLFALTRSTLPCMAADSCETASGAPLNIADGPFKPTVDSLKQYRCPDWFRDAKFGIWAHWGPQSVPMEGDWYARQMYEQGSPKNKYHVEHYGHPSVFGYKDIIPLWKAEKWDPDRLMVLYKKAGAKYFVSMGTHHDNFFLWKSNLHAWNSVNMGPHRDVVGEWQKAAQKQGLPFGVSEHLGASFWWFQTSHGADKDGAKAGVPYDGANPKYQDLYHFPAAPDDKSSWYTNNSRFHQLWYNEIKELVDNYHPDLLYSDGGVAFGNAHPVGLSMIAHLYNSNAALHNGKVEAVYNCKQNSEGRWVEDLERGIMPKIDPNPWQTDTSIGDWFYNRHWKYQPVSWVIHMLVDNVSKNGNLLLNVVLRPDGTLDPEAEEMLEELGQWNVIHGEAIYGSRPWFIYGESEVKVKGGSFKEDFKYNAKEIRFTTKGATLYAIALGWPEDGKLLVRSLGKPEGSDVNLISNISLLGYTGKLEWKQTAEGLLVTLPKEKVSTYTAAIRVTGTNLTNVPFAKPTLGGDARKSNFLAGIFTNRMVLQREMVNPIWGWTTPGATVTVNIEGTSLEAKAIAGPDGKWLAKLSAPPVGGPYTIKISGPQSVTLSNVLAGDVWLCAGQSNMGLPVSGADNATGEIAAAKWPAIRLISPTGKTALSLSSNIDGQWTVCSPESVADFSAVGYFFGRKLHQDLKIPIGLINLGWGGTTIETWTSRQVVTGMQPAVKGDLEILKRAAAGEDIYSAWYTANDPGSADNTRWASPAFDDSAWEERRLPNVPAWGCFGDLWNVYSGTLWFRSTFELAAADRDITLNFKGAGIDTVWVNGEKVGSTIDLKPRAYTIPKRLLKVGSNSLVFRFLQIRKDELLGVNCPAHEFTLTSANGDSKCLAGNWKFHLGASLEKAPALPLIFHQNTPSVVFNGMIAPLAPFAIKGAIWYQGETNTDDHAARYRKSLQAMIGCWRTQWGQGDFPFYIVQLPFYGGAQTQPGEGDLWRNWSAEMRESQAWAAANTPNSGLAVTLELGDAKNVHTTHKQEVGRRLALIALAKTYGRRLDYSGPVYRSLKIEGSAIRLQFALDGSPLVTRDNASPAGFSIAGEDRKWVWGEAKIAGDSIVVSSPKVTNPVAVRYAWSANPIGNLINEAGLPASPFRTDSWPLVSKED